MNTENTKFYALYVEKSQAISEIKRKQICMMEMVKCTVRIKY